MKPLVRTFARLRRLKRKIAREKLSPGAIAGGWALGMFIGCAIPFGFQLIVSVPLAMRLKVSKIGATLGTFITNPVTILFIYPAQTFAVDYLLFDGSITFERLRGMEWTFDSVASLGGEVMASFFIGGFMLAAILAPLTYLMVKRMVVAYRSAREKHDKP